MDLHTQISGNKIETPKRAKGLERKKKYITYPKYKLTLVDTRTSRVSK